MYLKKPFLFISFSLFFLYAFQNKKPKLEKQSDKIKAMVQEKIDNYLLQSKRECEEELIKSVELKTDSILMFEVQRLLKKDNIKIPTKPIKPTKPVLKESKE